jgi:hypothetical protein
VVIREYEQLLTDERRSETVKVRFPPSDEGPLPHPHIPGHTEIRTLTFAPGAPAAPTPLPGRMVFAETIEL